MSTAQTPTDAELVAAVVARDPRALAVLVQRHGGWATAFAERMTGDRQHAEDLVQNAFLRVWERAERWEARSRFSTWFYRIVHNLCIDQLRARRNHFEELDEDLPDTAASPEQQLVSEQRSLGVRAALAALPERQRAAIVLSHYQECSQAEAAEILGISEGALESLLSRARATLRATLREQLH